MNAVSPVETLVTDHLDLWTAALKRKSTVGRGSSSKVELYGIKKLRELILELAVRGLLVPQDPNDEPASELLKKIAVEKAKLIKAGKIKKDKPLPAISNEEKLFDLPSGWAWARLGGVGTVASSSRVHQKDWQSSGVPFFRTREIVVLSQHGFVNNELFISEELYQSFARSGLAPVAGDLMFTGVGTIGVPYVVTESDKFYFKDASVLIFKNHFGLFPRFLFYFMRSPCWINAIHEGSMGTTVHTLTIVRANNVLIPLPPLAEQHRIVAKVDELMALCDQLEQQTEASLGAHQTLVETLLSALTSAADHAQFASAWQRIAGHFDTLFTTEESIDQLKQTILQLAVMGKLVPQDPNDEPANVLLGRIATERARLADDGAIKRDKQPFDISIAQKPFEIPDRWIWCELSQLLALVTDGDHQAPPQSNDGVPFLVIGNLNTGKIKFDGCKYVPIDYYNKLDWVRKPIAGDLLYTVTGSFGIPVLVETGEPFCVQRHVAILKATDSTPRRYLELVLGSVFAIDYASKIATGIAQKTVPLTGLRRMPIPVAPEKEQHRIVAKVDELMALCEQLKSRLSDAQTTQLHLADALVEQAIG